MLFIVPKALCPPLTVWQPLLPLIFSFLAALLSVRFIVSCGFILAIGALLALFSQRHSEVE